jgi:hypothetical protein
MQRPASLPLSVNCRSQTLRISEAAAIDTIRTHKIGIAEAADGLESIFLATAPQIASGEAAEHRRAPGLCALALQGVEDFFDAVAHG